jgi:preprotein translocase subunit YajC
MSRFLIVATSDPLASFLQSPLPMVLMMLAIMYFLVFRPQQKKAKEHANMVAALQKNDEVITSSGIHGTVVAVSDKTVTVRIADNVRVEIEKSYILQKK